MISAERFLEVWEAIKRLDSKYRPKQVGNLLIYVVTHIEPKTGIVTLTRDELAKKVGTTPNKISEAMGQLEKLNVIRRERVKIPGLNGRGKVVYRLNPHADWNKEFTKRHD